MVDSAEGSTPCVRALSPPSGAAVWCRNHLFRLEFAFPEFRVAIECDARATHNIQPAFEKDRTRRDELVANGWAVIELTNRHFNDEPKIRGWIFKTLRQRGWTTEGNTVPVAPGRSA